MVSESCRGGLPGDILLLFLVVDYAGMICDITQQYLVTLCSDDVLVVSGRERGIGSAVSILCAVFSGWNEKLILLKSGMAGIYIILFVLHISVIF